MARWVAVKDVDGLREFLVVLAIGGVGLLVATLLTLTPWVTGARGPASVDLPARLVGVQPAQQAVIRQ